MDTLIVAAWWALINRLRGWGDGWNGTKSPAWLVWAQEYVFSRDILAVGQAAGTVWYLSPHGTPLAIQGALFLALAIGWRFAVSFGWGLYFSAFEGIWDKNESEVRWIDRIGLWLVPFVGKFDIQSNRKRGRICFALRGVYYLPMFSAAGLAVHSWWLLLPAAFFWQDGVVYGIRWRTGDNVLACELIGGAIRGALVGAALVVALQ